MAFLLRMLNPGDTLTTCGGRSSLRGAWLAVVGLLAAIRLVAFLPPEVNNFAASHYLFTYAGGFHKRALVGTLVGFPFQHVSQAVVYAISLGVLAVFALGLVLFARRALLTSQAILVLGLVLLGAPAVLPHFAYSSGYFDPLLVLCSLLALRVLASGLADWLKVPAAFLPCAIGVLTHESYVFAAFPLLAAYTVTVGSSRVRVFWSLTVLVVALTVVTQMFGQPAIPLARYMSEAAARTDIALNEEAFELLYFHTGQNMAYLLQHYSSVFTDARLLAGLIVPLPYFLMLGDLFRATAGALDWNGRTRILAAACILMPLVLALVGFDVLRWVSFACLNGSLLTFELIRSDPSRNVEAALSRYVGSARFAILALLSFSLGPLHVVDGNGIATGVHAIAHGLGLVQW